MFIQLLLNQSRLWVPHQPRLRAVLALMLALRHAHFTRMVVVLFMLRVRVARLRRERPVAAAVAWLRRERPVAVAVRRWRVRAARAEAL